MTVQMLLCFYMAFVMGLESANPSNSSAKRVASLLIGAANAMVISLSWPIALSPYVLIAVENANLSPF